MCINIFYLPKLDGRPCIKSDCQLLELHLGSKFAAAQIGSGGGYAEEVALVAQIWMYSMVGKIVLDIMKSC